MGAYVIKLRECSWMSVPILLPSLTPGGWRLIMRLVCCMAKHKRFCSPLKLTLHPRAKDNCSFIVSKVIGERNICREQAICVAAAESSFSKSSLCSTRGCLQTRSCWISQEKNSIAEKLCCVCMTTFFRQFNAMNEINEIRVIEHHDLQTTAF